MSKLPKSGKLLALDLGRKVTGVAISDLEQRVVFPRDELFHVNDKELILNLKQLIDEEAIVGLVVGLPVGWEGLDSRQTKWVRQIAAQLEEWLPLEFVDESLSTQEMEGVSRMKREDSEVAMALLTECLNAR